MSDVKDDFAVLRKRLKELLDAQERGVAPPPDTRPKKKKKEKPEPPKKAKENEGWQFRGYSGNEKAKRMIRDLEKEGY